MNPFEVMYSGKTSYDDFREMSPAVFHATFTLHDSKMRAGLFWYPGDDSVLLIFSYDIWNRDILDWDSNEEPYLFLEIQDVTTINRSNRTRGIDGAEAIIGGAETVIAGSGFVTTIDGIIGGDNIMFEHSGGFRVLFTSPEGDVIKFKKE